MATDHTSQALNENYFEENELYPIENDQFNDLHTYYMSQFNLELENSKNKVEENKKLYMDENFCCDFSNWNSNVTSNNSESYDSQILDKGIENNNVNETNIKDVLFDLDVIEFEEKNNCIPSNESDSSVKSNFDSACFDSNCDYIDDESLIDELCREDNEPYRLTPDIFNDSYLSSITNDKNLLPPIETAFSKHYNNFLNNEQQIAPITNDVNKNTTTQQNQVVVCNIENYSYPNNVIYNINNNEHYILPDTPTSCSEFTFDRGPRTVSISESVESDVHSSSYYDENSEGLDDDELFINLEDFGLTFDKDIEENSKEKGPNVSEYKEKKFNKEKNQGKIRY